MLLPGEYSIATRLMPFSRPRSPASSRSRPAYGLLFSRQPVEIVTLDRVHEAPRLAAGGNQVVPPPGGHLLARRQAGHPRRDRVRALKVVEQPAVEPSSASARWTSATGKGMRTSIPPGRGLSQIRTAKLCVSVCDDLCKSLCGGVAFKPGLA